MKDWPEKSPQAAYVLGCGAFYERILGTPLPPKWMEVAQQEAIHRYGPPILDNDQPITEDWLTSEGWEQVGECFDYEDEDYPVTIWRQTVLFEEVWQARIYRSDWPGPDLRTRGQLRALLTAIYGETR